MILKYSADEARNLKSYGEMLIDIYLCLMLKSRSRVSFGFFIWCLKSVRLALSLVFFQANSRSLSRSTKLWTLSEVNLSLQYSNYLSQISLIYHKYPFINDKYGLPGDLDDDIEFDDVDSEGSGSDEGDDIDGI